MGIFTMIIFFALQVIATRFIIPAIEQSARRFQPLLNQELVPRIAYGDPVDITEYPYFVQLQNQCGGAILSEQWVVTAAHCVNSEEQAVHILVGGEDEDYVETDTIIVHPYYLEVPIIVNDIALIKLAEPLKFNDKVKAINLPQKDKEFDVTSSHVFVGKGMDETGELSQQLKKMEVNLHTTASCYRYSEQYPLYYFIIQYFFMDIMNETTICASRVEELPGAGPGDSGSPMVKDGVLVGICSYGLESNHNNMMFLTKIAHYVPWIDAVIGDEL